MRQSGDRAVPAPRRQTRLLQRLLQSSGWRRWWRSLLGQQTGTSAVPGLHHKQEMRPQHATLRACAFSSPWIYVPLFAYCLWKEHQHVGGERSSWVEQSSPTHILASGIAVLEVDDWILRLSSAAWSDLWWRRGREPVSERQRGGVGGVWVLGTLPK